MRNGRVGASGGAFMAMIDPRIRQRDDNEQRPRFKQD
jgi:hypothetical protein